MHKRIKSSRIRRLNFDLFITFVHPTLQGIFRWWPTSSSSAFRAYSVIKRERILPLAAMMLRCRSAPMSRIALSRCLASYPWPQSRLGEVRGQDTAQPRQERRLHPWGHRESSVQTVHQGAQPKSMCKWASVLLELSRKGALQLRICRTNAPKRSMLHFHQ